MKTSSRAKQAGCKNPIALSICLLALVLLSCEEAQLSFDNFTGCYVHEGDDKVILRVRKAEVGYSLAVRSEQEWDEVANGLTHASEELIRGEFGADAAQIEKALWRDNELAFLRLREGAVLSGKPVSSRYFLAAFLIGGPVFETKCPD